MKDFEKIVAVDVMSTKIVDKLSECDDDALFKATVGAMVDVWCAKKGYSITKTLEEITEAGRIIENAMK